MKIDEGKQGRVISNEERVLSETCRDAAIRFFDVCIQEENTTFEIFSGFVGAAINLIGMTIYLANHEDEIGYITELLEPALKEAIAHAVKEKITQLKAVRAG